jgi:hypothetical protein
VAETTSTTTKITAVVGGVAAVVTGNLELLPAAVDLYEGGVTIGGIGQGAKATSLYAEGKSTEANMEAASIFASSVTGSWINTIPGLSEVTKVTAKTITDKAIETGKDKLKEELNKE